MHKWTERVLKPLLDETIKDGNLFCFEAERSVAASLIQKPKTTLEILTEKAIDEYYFESALFGNIFKVVRKLVDGGFGFDIATIQEVLKADNGTLEKHQDDLEQVLTELRDYPTDILPLHTNADILIDKCQRRQQIQDSIEKIHQAFNGKFVVKKESSHEDSTLMAIHKKWRENPSSHIGIQTIFKLLNGKIGGIRGLVCLLGTPKCGKSTFAMQIGQDAARQGVGVLYFDLENGVTEIMQRTLQAAQIILAETREEREEKAKNVDVEKLNPLSLNYRIYGANTIIDADSITSKIPKDKNTLVIIDSLHSLPPLHDSKRENIEAWLNIFNRIKSDNCSILFISELNRESYHNSNTIAGGKDSGKIEYSADVVLRLVPTNESEIYKLKVIASRHSGKGDVGKYGLTKWRYFVENPDIESFKVMRMEEETQNTRIIEAIAELKKENPLKRVYVTDLSKKVGMHEVPLGKNLSIMGYESKKDSTKSGNSYIIA